ncbi:MAG: ribosomal protein S18-alanine N-acetyltransferase [Lachnospiraceae bacterium]|nr:ribosomal protein S18-alanine N-acetyltransferase [Lachnospiraceae bacterium]
MNGLEETAISGQNGSKMSGIEAAAISDPVQSKSGGRERTAGMSETAQSSVNFRTITKRDIDAATALERENFSEPWPRSAFEEIVDKGNADYYLAEDPGTGELIGGCVIFRVLDEGDITNVAVKEEYRNRGIATELIQYATAHSESLGTEDFTLEVRASNASAIRVYEKCGFVSEGIRPGFYSRPREDAVIMWKRK